MFIPSDSRYDTMQYRQCGSSGLDLPAISLGLWQNFGEANAFDQQRKIVLAAFDAGITHIDLANNYGPPPGAAELSFGRMLATDLAPYRDELIISSKAGYRMWPGPYGEWGSKKYLRASLDQSLKRMGLEYVDIFYSHRFDARTPLEETMGALKYALDSGKATYVGISSYTAEQTQRAREVAADLGFTLLIHQPSYSMFNRWIEEGEPSLLDALDGMGAIVFSPLAQGLLTKKYLNGVPDDSRAAQQGSFKTDMITSEVVDRIRALDEIAEQRGQSLAQMAISWVLRDPRVTSALVGARTVEQLHDSLGALENLEFSQSELDAIDIYAVEASVNIWKGRSR